MLTGSRHPMKFTRKRDDRSSSKISLKYNEQKTKENNLSETTTKIDTIEIDITEKGYNFRIAFDLST